MKLNFIIALFTVSLLTLSCNNNDDDLVVNTATDLFIFKRSFIDVNNNNVLRTTEFDIQNNQIQTATSVNNATGITIITEFNYQNQLLLSTVDYQNGVLTGSRIDYTYDSNGLLTERLKTNNSSSFEKNTFLKVGNTTSSTYYTSTDGINYTAQTSSEIETNSNNQIVSNETTILNPFNKTITTYTYDTMGNLINEIITNEDALGNVTSGPRTFTMTYSTTSNPYASLLNDTYTKYGNNLLYPLRSGSINQTVGPTFISSNLLDTYQYDFAPSPTTLTSVLNSDGLVESITYLTTVGGNPFTSFKEEFFYQ